MAIPSEMIRTYKRKLILTKEQSERISSWIGACRTVYNLGMEIKNATYSATGKSLHRYALSRQVTELRKEIDWINDVPFDCLDTCLKRLDLSYSNFFRTFKSGGGFPVFAKKHRYKSIAFKEVLGIKNNKIRVAKIGWLRLFKDSDIIGFPKTATITKEPTGYFINIQCENVPPKFISENQAIGLDMGISHFCVDSNGNFISNPRHFKKYERQLRIENRSLAKKHKSSNRWKKQVKKLAMLHHKISNVRKDFLHKESTNIAKRYSLVYIEDLNIAGMSKNKNLSKHILDASWGTFKTLLQYKTTVIKVNPKFTSQTCNNCAAIDSKSRLSQSKFVCTSCGVESNADINAAKNILSQGMTLSRKRESLDCALALESHCDMSVQQSKV